MISCFALQVGKEWFSLQEGRTSEPNKGKLCEIG